MPTQVKVGLILTLGGLVGLIVALYFKLDAAVVAAAGLMSTGSTLLGKEMLPQSTHAQQIYSKRPPPVDFVGAVFVLLAIAGIVTLSACAGTPTPREALEGAKRAQESMERMCEELERTRPLREGVTDVLDQAANGTPVEPVLEQPSAPSPEGPAPADAPQ